METNCPVHDIDIEVTEVTMNYTRAWCPEDGGHDVEHLN